MGHTTDRRDVGIAGEALATEHLIANGYLIIARNLRIAGGEIDIIAQDGDELVIVEVRSATGQVDPLLSVSWPKQRQLRKLGAHYLQRLPCDIALRFDAIGVRFLSDGGVELEHLVDAF